MTEGYPLIHSNRRYRKKRIDFDGETLPVEKRPQLDVLLRATHFEIDVDKKVSEWLQEVPQWQEQPVWKPSEHPSSNRHDTFVHTYELGDDADHPIEIQDDGWFITREIVSDFSGVDISLTFFFKIYSSYCFKIVFLFNSGFGILTSRVSGIWIYRVVSYFQLSVAFNSFLIHSFILFILHSFNICLIRLYQYPN